MARRLTVLFFVAALFFFTLSPNAEFRLNAITQAGVDTQAVRAEDPVKSLASDTIPKFTPVPTPSPTPEPTPALPTPTPVPEVTPVPTPSPSPIVKGAKGIEVTKLQNTLINLGFLEGIADGIYGAGTVTAVNNVKTYLNDQYLKRNATVQFEGEAVVSPTETPALPYSVNGEADAKLLDILYSGGISENYETLVEGDVNSAVKRVQSRLNTLGYVYKGVDGAFGATTKEAISRFQQINGLSQTGIADKNTQELLFSANAKVNDRPLHEYKVVVDISEQRVFVYQWHEGSYSKLVRKMKCSSGARSTPTPLGTYDETVRLGERWHHFSDYNCWAQNAIHIDPTGNVMFHSVIYNTRGGSPTSGSVRSLGRRVSHGCVRLAVKDSKWLYESISDGTTVVVQK